MFIYCAYHFTLYSCVFCGYNHDMLNVINKNHLTLLSTVCPRLKQLRWDTFASSLKCSYDKKIRPQTRKIWTRRRISVISLNCWTKLLLITLQKKLTDFGKFEILELTSSSEELLKWKLIWKWEKSRLHFGHFLIHM